ncbi:MAG: helix-turn-helix domain-containing protein [Acidobacteria bacterium]|nr:helix-turn-helix domain-containing protein [Acidobacteriota bacterium]
MAEKSNEQSGLYTLTEVSNKTDISMPTLQRYKKLYQSRIPSVGKGRKQRYPEAALAVFEEIKVENLAKRGRPPKDKSEGRAKKAPARGQRKKAAAKATAPAAKETAAQGEELLTLTEVSKRTKISYPTLSRYVKQYSSQLKSKGSGRSRRFYPEALEVFKELRSQSRRGPGSGKAKAAKTNAPKASTPKASKAASAGTVDQGLMKRLAAIEKQLAAIEKKLDKPVQVTLRRG